MRVLRENSRSTIRGLIRFAILSGGSLAVNLGTTAVLHEVLGVPTEIAYALGLLTSFCATFLGLRHFVFERSDQGWLKQLTIFAGSSLVFRGLEYLAFLVLHSALGMPYLATILLVQASSALIKFFYYRGVFKPSGDRTPAFGPDSLPHSSPCTTSQKP